jgi:hypothetical protein
LDSLRISCSGYSGHSSFSGHRNTDKIDEEEIRVK